MIVDGEKPGASGARRATPTTNGTDEPNRTNGSEARGNKLSHSKANPFEAAFAILTGLDSQCPRLPGRLAGMNLKQGMGGGSREAQSKHSRPPMERMMRIHQRIENGTFPNCNTLAKKSVRGR